LVGERRQRAFVLSDCGAVLALGPREKPGGTVRQTELADRPSLAVETCLHVLLGLGERSPVDAARCTEVVGVSQDRLGKA